MRAQLIAEMRNVFGNDDKRIDHALKVLSFAEEILKHETGDPLTIRTAAILHDIGIHEAERKYNSSAGNYQELEGPPIAEKIMKKLNIPDEVIEHVCRIIGSHHSAKGIDTPEFRIIWDADWIVNIPDEYKLEEDNISVLIERVFKTTYGKKIALKKYS
jgi:HD superfamily phosphodiesterase